MILQIALIISILLQFIAAIVAITLIRKTKYNISWILVSIALLTMAVRRVIEFYEFANDIFSFHKPH